jgi:hypothetical protein
LGREIHCAKGLAGVYAIIGTSFCVMDKSKFLSVV